MLLILWFSFNYVFYYRSYLTDKAHDRSKRLPVSIVLVDGSVDILLIIGQL